MRRTQMTAWEPSCVAGVRGLGPWRAWQTGPASPTGPPLPGESDGPGDEAIVVADIPVVLSAGSEAGTSSVVAGGSGAGPADVLPAGSSEVVDSSVGTASVVVSVEPPDTLPPPTALTSFAD